VRVAERSAAIEIRKLAFQVNDHCLGNLLERDRTSGECDPLKGAEGVFAVTLANAS
jgi:hypothetical protein